MICKWEQPDWQVRWKQGQVKGQTLHARKAWIYKAKKPSNLLTCENDFLSYGNNLLTCGNDLLTFGNDLLTCGNDLVTCGNDFLTCGNDFLSCGNDLLTCGNDLVSCGNKFQSCGNDLLFCGNKIKNRQGNSSMSLPGLRTVPHEIPAHQIWARLML